MSRATALSSRRIIFEGADGALIAQHDKLVIGMP
jgi:hypothetical protein